MCAAGADSLKGAVDLRESGRVALVWVAAAAVVVAAGAASRP